VSSLFFNTPARQKFLKSQRSEEMKVKQWILQYCLAHPHITFALEFDGREVFRENARTSLEERARILVGGSVVAVQLQVNGIGVSGVLAHPGNAQGEAKGLTLLVNGRLVSDRMLLRAAKDGFGATLKDREFPVGVLSLAVPGSEVDVNVHPQKSEIRFRNSSAVYVAVLRAVQSAISEFRGPFGQSMAARGSMPAVVEFKGAANSASYYGSGLSGGTGSLPFSSVLSHDPHEVFATSSGATDNAEPQGLVRYSDISHDRPEFRFSDLAFRAQLFECYLLCEHAGQFFIVDMHAAHERYQYNQVRQALRERRRVSQKLLLPLAITLGEFGLSNLKEHEPMLEDLGFVFAWQADEQVQVTEVPAILSGKDVASMLRDIATLNPEDGGGVAPVDYILDQIAARIACHSSIRSGKRMAREEVEALFALLDSTECSAACPHGRPVVVSFSLLEVEAWFGRDK
jgi:DNA mismatch repair protein MutL